MRAPARHMCSFSPHVNLQLSIFVGEITIEQMEQSLRNINFFVGGLTVWLATQIFGGATGDRISVPSLDGLTVEKATVLLIDKGLTIGQISPENSERPIDTIISQIPQAGSQLFLVE